MTIPRYISPKICLEHQTGWGHPERPQRLDAIHRHLKDCGLLEDFDVVEARSATMDEISRVHGPAHVERVAALIEGGARGLDGDTAVSARSMEAARFAAGSALTGIDLMREGKATRVFCGVRPPGHHAESERSMGFCIFNNVALAAAHARATDLAERVLIIDWDVHHGNGTQQIFYESSEVFYYSLHQFPFYPGTGSAHEIGARAGRGTTLNRPLPAGTGEAEYLRLFERDLQTIGDTFKPQLILISAGFDAHRDDPLGGQLLTEGSFAEMTRMAVSLAETLAGGRVLSVLEGGYDLDALALCAERHLAALSP